MTSLALIETLAAARSELRAQVIASPEKWSTRTLASTYRSLLSDDEDIQLLDLTQRDFEKNNRIRTEIIRRIELYQSIDDWDAERLRLRTDPHKFFDDWVWMLDPRRVRDHELPVQPFLLFDFQREILAWIHDLYDRGRPGAMLKSRDLGASVMAAGFGVWGFLFFDGFRAGYGSYKEDFVWRLGSFDAIIVKAKMIIDSLPPQLRPSSWDYKEGHIANHDNGSEIIGEVGNQLGRAGRVSIFFADEFAYVREQQKSHQALSGTTECCIYLSTTAGSETHHAKIIRDKVMSTRVYPWWVDPRKFDDPLDVGNPIAPSQWKSGDPDDPDDRGKLLEVGDVGFAREYACDDIGAMEKTTIPAAWVRAAVDIVLRADGRIVAGLDLAESRDRSVLIIRHGGLVILHRSWEGMTMAEVANEALPLVISHGAEQIAYDRGGKGAEFGGIIARHPLRLKLPPVVGVVPTRAPTSRRYEDAPEVPAKHRFDYYITELWWSLRHRFRRTWEREQGIHDWADDDCISIPNDDRLIRQLTTRKWEEVARGKIGLESKRKLPESPDDADALVHCETPMPLVMAPPKNSGTYKRTSGAGRKSVW